MADSSSNPSPKGQYRKPPSFPRLFTGFTFKNFSETTEAIMSPTSILDTKLFFSGLKSPFWPDPNPSPKTPEFETARHWDKLDSKGVVGLGLVDALDDDTTDPTLSKPETRMVLFGSQLKIQIPPLPPSSLPPAESPTRSSADFGIKTRNSPLGSFSSGLSPPLRKSPFGSDNSGMDTPNSTRVFSGCLSASEMELSEDYTCVISHGSNPRTTHIFDNCIVESCCGVVGFSDSRNESDGFFGYDWSSYPTESFLSLCYACKKNLGPGKDIYMYRGEKAFCSRECRHQEMMLEDGIDKLKPDDVYGTLS